MKQFKHGDKVSFNKRLIRIKDGNYKRYWKEIETSSFHNAIYLGTRTISSGHREWESEIGYYWIAESYINCALVSPSSILNPMYVLLESIVLEL